MSLYLSFSSLQDESTGLVNKNDVISALRSSGLLRISSKIQGPPSMDFPSFKEVVGRNVLIQRALDGSLVVPDFQSLKSELRQLFDTVNGLPFVPSDGTPAPQNASYIPELKKVDPSLFSVSVCTVDGQRCMFGDATCPFTMQHCTNALSYCIVLEDEEGSGLEGLRKVHSRVGREPSGSPADTLMLNYENRPHNPFTNAGALTVASMLLGHFRSVEEENVEVELSDAFDHLISYLRRAAGGETVGYNMPVFLSEKAHSDRNRCLCYLLREKNVLPKSVPIDDILNMYLMGCSLEMDATSMSVFAATLAAGGVCPVTRERVFRPSTVRSCLTIMASSALYDASGEWAFEIGLPAVAGASGALMVIVPNVMGVAIFSPPVNGHNISWKGMEFARRLVQQFSFHPFESSSDNRKRDPSFWRLTSEPMDASALCAAAAKGDSSEVRRLLAKRRMNVNAGNYDGRTALHLACAFGKADVVALLVANGGDPAVKDRWGRTPKDELDELLQRKDVRLVSQQQVARCLKALFPHGSQL